MSYWHSLTGYTPVGTTGDGKCHRGKCGLCNEDGTHIGKLGRHPKDGPRGPAAGATKAKNSLPVKWLTEMLQAAITKAEQEGCKADVVVDTCAGWQSLKCVCESLGLRYVAIDIYGDRNAKAKSKTKSKKP